MAITVLKVGQRDEERNDAARVLQVHIPTIEVDSMKVRDHVRSSGYFRAYRPVVVTYCVAILSVGSPGFAHHDPSERIAELSRRIEIEPENGDLYTARGELHRVERSWAAAEADFRAAIVLNPRDDLARLQLGTTLLDAGRFREAAGVLDGYLAGHPRDVSALITRARIRTALGDPKGAVDDWRTAIPLARASGSDTPEHYLELASSLVACGRTAEALPALEEGSLALARPIVLELRALELEVDLGRVDEALERVSRLEHTANRTERFTARRAEILEQAGRRTEACDSYRETLLTIEALPPARRATRRELETRARASLERLSVAAKMNDERNAAGMENGS